MISLVMATFSEFKDTIYTTMANVMAHPAISEVICVNNNPGGPDAKKLKAFYEKNPKFKYIELASPQGTAAPRDLAIRSATKKFVICVDSHVILHADSVDSVKTFFDQNPDKIDDIVQGPILNERLEIMASSFKDVWGVDVVGDRKIYSEMWGQWHRDPNETKDKFKDQIEPFFEIPAQGLGAFAVKQDSWLGFNPHMKGFGGEEFYIHSKYRKAGRKCWCLSKFQWWHLFGEPKTYPLQRGHKCRNYVLGLTEIGIPLDRAYEHFVTSKMIPQAEWDMYVAEAEKLHSVKTLEPPAMKSETPKFIELGESKIKKSDYPSLQKAAAEARAYRLKYVCGELGAVLENTVGCRGMKKHICGKGLHNGQVCPASECISCTSYDDIGPEDSAP